MKTAAISGLPVSVTIYTETGLPDPQKKSPKQRISSVTADTKANQCTDATCQNEVFDWHSAQPRRPWSVQACHAYGCKHCPCCRFLAAAG